MLTRHDAIMIAELIVDLAFAGYAPPKAPEPVVRRTLGDRVKAVVDAAGGQVGATKVFKVLNTGSDDKVTYEKVSRMLSQLYRDGLITKVEHGQYAPKGWEPSDEQWTHGDYGGGR